MARKNRVICVKKQMSKIADILSQGDHNNTDADSLKVCARQIDVIKVRITYK
jgi:hypothetical protein